MPVSDWWRNELSDSALSRLTSQVKSSHLSPNFIKTAKTKVKDITHKCNSAALFLGGCWIPLTGRFHRRSAAGWAECTVADPGRVRRHAVKFSERYSAPLMAILWQTFPGCSPGFSQRKRMTHSGKERTINRCIKCRCSPKDFEEKSLGGDQMCRHSVCAPDK